MATATKETKKRVHRDYQNTYPSVTTVLGVLRKIALEYWFKTNTFKFITEESNKGKVVGKDIHTGVETFIQTGKMKVETEYPEEVTNALKSFALFLREHPELRLQWSEMALTSEKHKFNGTIDCVGFINDKMVILDWKTATCKEKEKPDIYDEYKYQVSAYVHLFNENNPETIVKDAVIVPVAKDKISYNFFPLCEEEISDCFNEVFLPALQILNYQRSKKEYV